MGITEAYQREQERIDKEEKAKAGIVEKEPLTVKEILADKEKSDLFVQMLVDTGEEEDEQLADQIAKSEIRQEDHDRLEKQRVAFEKKMDQVETIKKELTVELITDLGKNDQEFKALLGKVTADNMKDVVDSRLNELAISDSTRFEKLLKAIEQKQSDEGDSRKKLDDSVKKMCDENGWDETAYAQAMLIKDHSKREEAFSEMVRASWGDGFLGWYRRLFDTMFAGSGSGKDVQTLEAKKNEVGAWLAELENHKKNIGSVLSATIKGNYDMTAALSKAIFGESLKVERVGFKDMKNTFPSDPKVDQMWEECIQENVSKKHKSWDKFDDDEKDRIRDEFVDGLKKDGKKYSGRGLWGAIFANLFNPFIDTKKASLK